MELGKTPQYDLYFLGMNKNVNRANLLKKSG